MYQIELSIYFSLFRFPIKTEMLPKMLLFDILLGVKYRLNPITKTSLRLKIELGQ